MFLKYTLLAVFAFSSGTIISGGVFSTLVALGLIPRFAEKTHTGKKIFLYEEMVVFGTIVGDILSVFGPFWRIHLPMNIGYPILILFGIFAGIFVGCLALAIAEMLNAIPIFCRRIGFRHGLGIMILSIALGKCAGSLFFFIKQMANQ